MNHYKTLIDSIILTPNYPMEGILFADLSPMLLYMKDLTKLMEIWGRNLGVDSDAVVVALPTRGFSWAAIFASVFQLTMVQLRKEGGSGTSLPGDNSIAFQSKTVYSSESKPSVFIITGAQLEICKRAKTLLILDDVCESGATMNAAKKYFQKISDNLVNIRCMPVLDITNGAFPSESKAHHPMIHIKENGTFTVGAGLQIRPELLAVLRGYPLEGALQRTEFKFPADDVTVVYGLPSMNAHMVSFCKMNPDVTIIGDIKWNCFPNGKPDIQFSQYQNCNKIIWFYDGFTNDKTQDLLVHALARNTALTLPMEVIIPYFADGTMERVDRNGTLATAQSVLHSLCASMPRPVTMVVGDIHHTGTRFYTTDKVGFKDLPLMRALFDAFIKGMKETIIVVFPDDGSFKRYGPLFPEYTAIICGKIRNEGQRNVSIREIKGMNNPLDPENATKKFSAIIVDDLIRSGSTILSVAELIRSNYPSQIRQVIAMCVHADFNPGECANFLQSKHIDFFVTTNTCYEKAYKASVFHKIFVYDFVKLSRSMDFSREYFDMFGEENSQFAALASSSEEKLTGLMAKGGRFLSGVWTFDTPNLTAEQLIGENEAIVAANQRMEQLRAFESLNNTEKIVINSFTKDCSTSSGLALKDCLRIETETASRRVATTVEGQFFPSPHLFAEELKKTNPKKRKVFGETLRELYNLQNKSSWVERGTRVQLMKKGLEELWNKQ